MIVVLPFVSSISEYRVGCVIDGNTYYFDVHWNARAGLWFFDCYETDLTPIAHGVPIVLGTYLARSVQHVLFRSGAIAAIDTSGQARDAGFDDLGDRVNVAWYSVDELAKVQP